jgi:hypothetical protein
MRIQPPPNGEYTEAIKVFGDEKGGRDDRTLKSNCMDTAQATA